MPWLGRTDARAACRRDENLCTAPEFTGWDLDGGYADTCLVDEGYAYRLPENLSDERAAPLCAGIIGYRALRYADVPPGGRLGIYGFGGSAHLTAQLALRQGMRVHVLTRGEHNRRLAADLGVDSVGAATRRPNRWTARSSSPPPVTSCRSPCVPWTGGHAGGRRHLAVGDPGLDYAADLFQERRLRSVTANTRADGEEFLRLAGRSDISATTVAYPMAEAPAALRSRARAFRRCRRPAQLTRLTSSHGPCGPARAAPCAARVGGQHGRHGARGEQQAQE